MIVRMLRRISGTRNRQPWPTPGETIDIPEAEAKQLARLGYAAPAEIEVELREEPAVETATVTTTRRQRRRKGA